MITYNPPPTPKREQHGPEADDIQVLDDFKGYQHVDFVRGSGQNVQRFQCHLLLAKRQAG